MASQLLGSVGTDGNGLVRARVLARQARSSGPDGERRLVKDALGQPIEMRDTKPTEPGQDVKLTLDAQPPGPGRAGARRGRRRRGSPRARRRSSWTRDSGAILALANWPRVNANDPGERARLRAPGPRDRRHLRAGLDVQGVHRRGRARGAARSRRTRSSTSRRRSRSPTARSATPRRAATCTLTTRQILKQSSNVGAVHDRPAARRRRSFDQWVRALRLRQADRRRPPGRGAAASCCRSTQYSGSSMGNLPIGQGIAVTPMQMAAAYSRDRQRRHPAPAAHRRLGRRQREPRARGPARDLRGDRRVGAHDARGRARPGRHRVRRRDPGLRARRQDRHGAEADPVTGGYSQGQVRRVVRRLRARRRTRSCWSR